VRLLYWGVGVLKCYMRLAHPTHDSRGAKKSSHGSFLCQENLREDNDTRCHL
jgi:hypothetical protein